MSCVMDFLNFSTINPIILSKMIVAESILNDRIIAQWKHHMHEITFDGGIQCH